MKHWKCENTRTCQHEWDGEDHICSWCGGHGKLLEESKPPPYRKMMTSIQRHFTKAREVRRKFY